MRRIFILLMLVGLLFSQTAAQAQSGFQISAPLQLPGNVQPGQAVTAQFTISNGGSQPLLIQALSAGVRGPGCNNMHCAAVADFTTVLNVTIQPGASYTYRQSRSFSATGNYMADVAYQIDGNWQFANRPVWFSVGQGGGTAVRTGYVPLVMVSSPGSGLEVAEAVALRGTSLRQNDIVYARFTVRNPSNAPLYLRGVGTAVRGPNCPGNSLTCGDVQDFPFRRNVTIPAGGTLTVEERQQLPEAGTYYAFIVAIDANGVVRPLTSGAPFTVQPALTARRTSPWRFGVNIYPYWNDGDLDLVTAAQAVGADMLRVTLQWPVMQPNGPTTWEDGPHWRFEHLTNIIDWANQRGMVVMVTLTQSPCWASGDPGKNCAARRYNPNYPPATPAHYARAMQELVRRYGARLAAYEVWNEPNDARHWTNPDAVRYTELLRQAYTAAKSENPAAFIVGGALAGTLRGEPGRPEFLEVMYANAANRYYDALSIHPYSRQVPGDCSVFLYGSYRCGVEGVRALMLHNNDTKPIWFTEFGWSSSRWGEGPQLNYLRDGLRLVDTWDYVQVAAWFSLCDTGAMNDGALGDAQMGLYTQNCAQPKQAARWLQANGAGLPDALYRRGEE